MGPLILGCSHSFYFCQLAFFQITVWALLLLSSYFYFKGGAAVDVVRVAH